ncbi:MAG: hypothetical protein COB56_08835 [Robiginitomaculum sp.]|nr:MAG: hypothetical protein COB56_08835 [Robiginitomaculum sp.]
MIALTMGACATIKPAMEVQVRPVLKSTRSVDQQNFHIETALAEAQKLQRLSDYAASYDAYNVLLMHMRTTKTEHKVRADIFLGLADSALSLSWRGATYKVRAREIYNKISEDADGLEEHKRRAKSGILLLNIARFKPGATEKYLHFAIEDSPNDPRLWNALGKVRDGNANWLEALDAYIHALAIAKQTNANTAAIVNNMGMSLLMQGRKKEALIKFKQAYKSNPEMPVYDNNVRLAQTLLGNTSSTLKGLSETRTAQIYNDAGVIAQAQGKLRKAKTLYKKAIEKSPVYFAIAEKNLAGLMSNKALNKPEHTPA